MLRKLYHVLIIPMLAVFLLSTQGFSVYEHYCNTSQTSSIALFSSVECKHHNDTEESCHHCCTEMNNSACQIPQKFEDNCCTDFHTFVKAEIQVFVPSSEEIKIQYCPCFTGVTFWAGDYHVLMPNDNETEVFRPKQPPKTGRFTVILLQSLKIPEFLS